MNRSDAMARLAQCRRLQSDAMQVLVSADIVDALLADNEFVPLSIRENAASLAAWKAGASYYEARAARERNPRGGSMSRVRWVTGIALALVLALWLVGTALASTSTVTRSDGYQVTLTGPSSATVGAPTGYTATCGPVGWYGSPCPYGEFRAFGGVVNRLGEGFGRGASGFYVFRAAGSYAIRYRVGASCIGSPRLACPIDAWVYTVVGA